MIIQLPAVYRAFIDTNGLYEGFAELSGDEHYVIRWGENDVAIVNSKMEVDVYAPSFVAFAGDGDGEIYAFDTGGAVFVLPMIGMEPEAAFKWLTTFSSLRGVLAGSVVGKVTGKRRIRPKVDLAQSLTSGVSHRFPSETIL